MSIDTVLPEWALARQQPFRLAPPMVRRFAGSKGIRAKHFASRRLNGNVETVFWDKKRMGRVLFSRRV